MKKNGSGSDESQYQEITQRLHRLIDDSPAGYFSIDRQGCYEKVNQAWLGMHGYTHSKQVLGRHFSITQVDSDRERAQQVVETLMQGQIIPTGEFSRRNRDGSTGWHIFTAWPVQKNGQVYGLEGFIIDTTARKLLEQVTEAHLRLVERVGELNLDQLLTAILDELEQLTGSQVGFFHFVDEDQMNLTLQTWSTRTLTEMCTAEGKSSHYPISLAGVWTEAFHQLKPVIHNDYAALSHRKGLPEGHASVLRELVVPVIRNGLVVAILGVGNKPIDYNQRDVETVVHLANLAWDLALRKRMEQALEKSAGEWSDTFDAVSDAICLLDLDQNILRANRAMAELVKIDADKLVGQQCWRVVHGTQQPLEDCPIKRMKQTLKRESMELNLTDRMYEVTVDPLLDEQCALRGAVHIVRDVSERVRLEKSMQNEMDKLEFMNSMMVDRELRMGELKKEINSLLEAAGKARKY